MPDDRSEQASPWPLPKFSFRVTWGSTVMSFEEVSGLDVETQPIEYREGDNLALSTIEMPGIMKFRNVTMRNGVFKSDDTFWDWLGQLKMNTIHRVPVTISLVDESGKPTMVWSLANAWPVKFTGTDQKATGQDVAVESIEIAHEGLIISRASVD